MYRPGYIAAFTGLLGSGKTLSMTYFAHGICARGVPVYANYDVVYAARLQSLRQMFGVRNGLLLLDELQGILDSREFARNVDMTQWGLLIRKLGLRMYYTTQDIGQVDLRVRNITNRIFCCREAKHYGQLATLLEVYDRQSTGFYRLSSTMVLKHSSRLYGLYDTHDMRVKLTLDGLETPFKFGDTETLVSNHTSAPQPPGGLSARR